MKCQRLNKHHHLHCSQNVGVQKLKLKYYNKKITYLQKQKFSSATIASIVQRLCQCLLLLCV